MLRFSGEIGQPVQKPHCLRKRLRICDLSASILARFDFSDTVHGDLAAGALVISQIHLGTKGCQVEITLNYSNLRARTTSR